MLVNNPKRHQETKLSRLFPSLLILKPEISNTHKLIVKIFCIFNTLS